jgi:hypothetical protein
MTTRNRKEADEAVGRRKRILLNQSRGNGQNKIGKSEAKAAADSGFAVAAAVDDGRT